MQTQRSPADWGLFLLLSACWASAFAMTKVAVDDLPPSVIIPGRLITGALVLWLVMLVRGERLPPFTDRASWLAIVGMGRVLKVWHSRQSRKRALLWKIITHWHVYARWQTMREQAGPSRGH